MLPLVTEFSLSLPEFSRFLKTPLYPGICLYENLFTDSCVDVTSVNFNSKKIYEDEIFDHQAIFE